MAFRFEDGELHGEGLQDLIAGFAVAHGARRVLLAVAVEALRCAHAALGEGVAGGAVRDSLVVADVVPETVHVRLQGPSEGKEVAEHADGPHDILGIHEHAAEEESHEVDVEEHEQAVDDVGECRERLRQTLERPERHRVEDEDDPEAIPVEVAERKHGDEGGQRQDEHHGDLHDPARDGVRGGVVHTVLDLLLKAEPLVVVDEVGHQNELHGDADAEHEEESPRVDLRLNLVPGLDVDDAEEERGVEVGDEPDEVRQRFAPRHHDAPVGENRELFGEWSALEIGKRQGFTVTLLHVAPVRLSGAFGPLVQHSLD